MKIKQRCNDTGDFWKHAHAYIDPYFKYGDSESRLKEMSNEIAKISKDSEIFTYIVSKTNTMDEQIPLVINWHQQSMGYWTYFMKVISIW